MASADARRPAPRNASTFVRKMAAIILVLSSLTLGIIGLGAVSGGSWWGALLILAAPFGIWGATRITPEGATTGYFDENL